MKKIIGIILCLLMVVTAFTGCFLFKESKPKTFKEAAEAGKKFSESSGLKDVKLLIDISGEGFPQAAKVVFEGQYEPKAEQAVISVIYDMGDYSVKLKDEIKINGKKLYIKIPDVSTVESLGLGSANSMMESYAGKYLMITLPEKEQISAITGVFDSLQKLSNEKAEDIEAEAEYPYVANYSYKNFTDLMVGVLDNIKENKGDITGEIDALAKTYLGSENYDMIAEQSGKTAAESISEWLDLLTKDAETGSEEEPDNFKLTQKIAYEKNKSYENVTKMRVENGNDTVILKITYTVSAAEKDPEFEDKCSVSKSKAIDFAEEFQEYFKNEYLITDAEKIVGAWYGDFNMKSILIEELKSLQSGGFVFDENDIDDISVVLVFEFKKDGTCSITFDNSSFDNFIVQYENSMRSVLETYFRSAAESYGITYEDFLSVAGYTSVDDFLDQYFTDETKNDLKNQLANSAYDGKYKAEKGKLYTVSNNEEFNAFVYTTYVFTSSTQLVLTGATGNSDILSLINEQLLPMTLNKR